MKKFILEITEGEMKRIRKFARYRKEATDEECIEWCFVFALGQENLDLKVKKAFISSCPTREDLKSLIEDTVGKKLKKDPTDEQYQRFVEDLDYINGSSQTGDDVIEAAVGAKILNKKGEVK